MLIWLARLILALCLVATLLPFVPVGAWFVRLCDFPRLQLAAITVLPLSAAVALGFTVGWQREYLLLVGVSLLIIGWQVSHVAPFSPMWSKEVPDLARTDGSTVRIAVANIQYDNPKKSELLATLREIDADILLLIEIDEPWHEALQPLREQVPHGAEHISGEGLGLAFWSRLPLAGVDVQHLVSERRPSIHADVQLQDGQLIRFVGVHPTPPGLNDSTNGGRRDSRVRDAELVMVAKDIAQDPERTWIVTGDFNDVAWSHTTRLFKRLSGLQDPRVGREMLNTYHADYSLLRYPIDHMFVSTDCSVGQIERFRLPGSDHFGLLADLKIAASESHEVHVDEQSDKDDHQEADRIIDEGKQDAAERGVAVEQ